MNTKGLANLLTLLRCNSKGGQVSSLAIECLLHVAEEPKTFQELSELTGAQNAHISRAVSLFSPHIKGKELMKPDLHLLTRKKRAQPLRGYSVHLSKGGRELLTQAGII